MIVSKKRSRTDSNISLQEYIEYKTSISNQLSYYRNLLLELVIYLNNDLANLISEFCISYFNFNYFSLFLRTLCQCPTILPLCNDNFLCSHDRFIDMFIYNNNMYAADYNIELPEQETTILCMRIDNNNTLWVGDTSGNIYNYDICSSQLNFTIYNAHSIAVRDILFIDNNDFSFLISCGTDGTKIRKNTSVDFTNIEYCYNADWPAIQLEYLSNNNNNCIIAIALQYRWIDILDVTHRTRVQRLDAFSKDCFCISCIIVVSDDIIFASAKGLHWISICYIQDENKKNFISFDEPLNSFNIISGVIVCSFAASIRLYSLETGYKLIETIPYNNFGENMYLLSNNKIVTTTPSSFTIYSN